MKTALTIAGADPSGGAGIQADLKAFLAFKVTGLSAITSLTAQNNRGVKAVLPVPPAFLMKQIEVLLEEFTIDAVKIGMVGSSSNIAALAKLIRGRGLKNVVLDPVISSTGGYPLVDKKGLAAIKGLLPLVKVVTPNIPEAEAISGLKIEDAGDMEEAAEAIFSLGPEFVLVKGGHLSGEPVDMLFDGKRFYCYEGKRIRGRRERFHGTGCMLSSAIAAGLANGRSVKKAAGDAKMYVNKALSERVLPGC